MQYLEKPLSQLLNVARSRPQRRLVVAAAEDKSVLQAVWEARNEKIVAPVLVGDSAKIREILRQLGGSADDWEIVHEPDASAAASRSVGLIREGKGEILMKGYLPTAVLLKAVLHKENGIRESSMLSHVTLFEIPSYQKLLGLSDAAINIQPTVEEKAEIIRNAVKVFHRLGVEKPLVAVLGPVETVNPKIESTVHAAMLAVMQVRKQIPGCIIDGPLAMDNAISAEAARHKHIESPVAGNADILIAPDLDAANILYKSLIFFGGAVSAAIITGARVPVVLTSRADSERSKLLSIALAAALE